MLQSGWLRIQAARNPWELQRSFAHASITWLSVSGFTQQCDTVTENTYVSLRTGAPTFLAKEVPKSCQGENHASYPPSITPLRIIQYASFLVHLCESTACPKLCWRNPSDYILITRCAIFCWGVRLSPKFFWFHKSWHHYFA